MMLTLASILHTYIAQGTEAQGIGDPQGLDSGIPKSLGEKAYVTDHRTVWRERALRQGGDGTLG